MCRAGRASPTSAAEFIAAHLRALACAARKFAGEDVGFVDEVHDYFDVQIGRGDPDRYRAAHARIDEVLGGSGPLAERMDAHRRAEEIPPAPAGRSASGAFSSALRDIVRTTYPLPDAETVVYEVVTDKPWSGFNYYEGDYRSRVAINADLKAADGQPAAAGGPRVLSGPPHRALPQGSRVWSPGWARPSRPSSW